MSLAAFFSMDGGWFASSIIAAMFSAVMFLVNQYYKQSGVALVFWMRVCIVIIMTPFMASVVLPQDPLFYIAVAVTVLLASLADVRVFDVAAQHGGGVVSRIQPLIVWGSFLLWFLFDPSALSRYIAAPFNSFLILLTLGGCVYFAQRLNKCAITRQAAVAMMPALVAYALTTVLNKYAMDHHGGAPNDAAAVYGAVLSYMYFQSALAVLVFGPYLAIRLPRKSSKEKVFSRPLFHAVSLLTLGWVGHMVFKNYAMAYTPNPSYVAALNLTAPIFISAFYMLRRHKETADVASGMGIVGCAVLLALLTV